MGADDTTRPVPGTQGEGAALRDLLGSASRLEQRKLLGLRLLDADDDVEQSPIALLFRASSSGVVGTTLDELAADRSLLTLGDFVSSQRDLAWLEERLGWPRRGELLDGVEPRDIPDPRRAGAEARPLAAHARRALGLGEEESIPSMLELLDRLEIEVVWAEPDTLTPEIEGASLLAPAPAILINPVFNVWWRIRMTLAHELCHLLYDRACLSHERRFFAVSPRRRGQHIAQHLRLFDDLVAIEQRASAFAAYFLAPPAGVLRVTDGQDPRSDEAILAVCSRFGVGWEAAVNVICWSHHGVSWADRDEMSKRRHGFEPPTEFFGRDAPSQPPRPRRGRLARCVSAALEAELIDGIDARILLDLLMDDPLPDGLGLPEALRRPLRDARAIAMRHAGIALWHAWPERNLRPANPRRTSEGWALDVLDRDDGEVLGTIQLSDEFAVQALPDTIEHVRK